VIATASAIPVQRSRGRGEDGQREHLDPVQPVDRGEEQVRRAGRRGRGQGQAEAELQRRDDRGGQAGHQRKPRGGGGARAARGPGQGDRDDGDARGRQALGQGELRGDGRAVPGQRRDDLGAAGAETGGGRRDGQPGDPGQRVTDAGQAGDG
jgi:hypothetical protein